MLYSRFSLPPIFGESHILSSYISAFEALNAQLHEGKGNFVLSYIYIHIYMCPQA